MPQTQRKPLVDHVLEHYKLIRNSDRHLSAADRFRLDGHMQMLAEVQRRVSAAPTTVGVGCASPQRSAKAYPYNFVKESGGLQTPPDQLRSPSESIALHQLYNDIIAAAFKCGMTRVAAVHPYEKNDPFSSYKGNWHDAAHDGRFDDFEEAYRNFFDGVVLDLALKLDEDEGDGRTYLDNTLICWLNEHGALTHAASNKKLVTLGSAGGYFKTGQFLDVRNTTDRGFILNRSGTPLNTGLTMNQWWANVLDALGIPRSEWERYGMPGRGYGPVAVTEQSGSGKLAITPGHYVSGPLERSGDKFPVLVA